MILNTRVTPLKCGSCGAPLDGLRGDAAFSCIPCRSVLSIEKAGNLKLPLRIAPPSQLTELPTCLLPMYRMDVVPTVLTEQGADITGRTPVAEFRTVWVCGFFEFRPSYFGNPGFDMTASQAVTLDVEVPPAGSRVIGIARSAEQARLYPKVFISAILDRRKDVSGLSISVSVEKLEIWGIPFGVDRERQQLLNLVTGERYPLQIVETLAEML